MMWRLVIPLMVATVCAWVVLVSMPEKWQGPVWQSMKDWLRIAGAVVGCLFLISVVVSLFFN
jgi:hypothetical protein